MVYHFWREPPSGPEVKSRDNMTMLATLNIQRLLSGGLAAGLVINVIEYSVHGMFLDAQWTAAFAALGKTPTGRTTFSQLSGRRHRYLGLRAPASALWTKS